MRQGQLLVYPGCTETKPVITLSHVEKTETAVERTKGLLGRPELTHDEALWIIPCNSVHTIGMNYPLDIIYIDRNNLVKKTVQNLVPLRMSLCPGGHSTIELRAGSIELSDIKVGSRIKWLENKS